MAKATLDPCPKCGAVTNIFPQAGGGRSGELTIYRVECSKCPGDGRGDRLMPPGRCPWCRSRPLGR